jgi:glycosyltransferase involved in cell wall biosynthesis
MNADSAISVVIPAYNAEKYLRKTLAALLLNDHVSQILVVDDCSTDDTVSIIEKYAQMDSRISMLHTQRNTGAGAARNLAIPHVTGEYCAFIDADDHVEPRGMDEAAAVLHTLGGDFLAYKWYQTDMHGQVQAMRMAGHDEALWATATQGERRVLTDARKCPWIMRTLNFPWNKMYRTEFLVDKGIRFSATFIHNDNLAHWMSYTQASSFVLYDRYLIGHKEDQRRTQISTIMDRRRLQLFDAFQDIDEFFSYGALHTDLYPYFVCYKRDLLSWFGPQIQTEVFTEFCDRVAATFVHVTSSLLFYINSFDPQAARDIFDMRCHAEAFFSARRQRAAIK